MGIRYDTDTARQQLKKAIDILTKKQKYKKKEHLNKQDMAICKALNKHYKHIIKILEEILRTFVKNSNN